MLIGNEHSGRDGKLEAAEIHVVIRAGTALALSILWLC